MADAFEVLAKRLVDLETITNALTKHKENFPARDEFCAFAQAVQAARETYEHYLAADLRWHEQAEIAADNQAQAYGLNPH